MTVDFEDVAAVVFEDEVEVAEVGILGCFTIVNSNIFLAA